MKNKLLYILSGTTLFSLLLSGVFALSNSKTPVKVDAIVKPTNINLNDTSEASIRSYYSYLDTLPETERRGTNLLKNLKYILVNNPSNSDKSARYFSYSQCREIYRITDRQWTASPASEISGYDSTTNTITGFNGYSDDPYLYYYYRSDNFSNPHTASATVTSKEGKSQTLLNQEHLWSVSHGFKGDSTTPAPNAGSDLHHLVAADVAGNKWGHSNYTYGNVDVEDSGWVNTRDNWDNYGNAILNNKRGTPVTTSSLDESTTVFEPQDADKGDVARALFYMAARYNYYGDNASNASQIEPDLEIVDYITDENITITCDGTNGTGKYGILTDLLDWHKNDPVTSASDTGYYELHRNNLIYENFQYTRNPFIDFPEWVDYVWGSQKDTGVASPATDTLYGYKDDAKPTSITLSDSSLNLLPGDIREITVTSVTPSSASKAVTWSSSDSSVVSVNSSGSIQAIKAGNATITATSTEDSNVKAYLNVIVSGVAVTGVSLNKINLSIEAGSSETLTATVSPSNASNKDISWSSSNDSVVSVSNGVITALATGTATVTVTTSDGGFTASCVCNVIAGTDKYYTKITSTSALTTGNYLIVCENADIAMDGSLARNDLTASNNHISLDGKINKSSYIVDSSPSIDAATFYYDSTTSSLKSSSGLYIGATSNTGSSLSTSETNPYTLDFSFDENGNALIYSHTHTSARIQVYQSKNFKFYITNQAYVQLYKQVNQGGGGGEVTEKSYKKISELSDVTTGNYVIASKKGSDYYAMSKSFPTSAGGLSATQITVTNDEISLENANAYVVSIVASGTSLTISNETSYLTYASSTNVIASDTSDTWSIALVSDEYSGGTFDITNGSRHLAFAANNATPIFKAYASIGSNYHTLDLFKYTETTVSYSKLDLANDIMDSIVCDDLGRNEPTFAPGFSWSELKTRYQELPREDQEYLADVEANELSEDVIERAMYRYDYIISKYGTSSYEDFISRKPSNLFITNSIFTQQSDCSIQIVLVVITLSIPLVFIGYKLIKKKEN